LLAFFDENRKSWIWKAFGGVSWYMIVSRSNNLISLATKKAQLLNHEIKKKNWKK
jgi:hypothetical protein